MSSRADFFPPTLTGQPTRTFDFEVAEECPRSPSKAEGWSLERYGEEQIRGLVRQVFFPGWPRPARQAVFSTVGEGDAAGISLQIAQTLAAQIPGSVCVVQAWQEPGAEENHVEASSREQTNPGEFRSLRDWARQLSSKLWTVPLAGLVGENGNAGTADVLAVALRELRLEFDYTILQGPPTGVSNEAALLGHLSDGVILVLEAGSTRKLAAQRAKQMLHEANARCLGVVLDGRRFPIPEGLYRHL
ncbi:MAG TPA: hypothetical protein VLW84_09930 [Terriglobales bacterium]|nr:hypothetical protein [Terriglobales bacterium]